MSKIYRRFPGYVVVILTLTLLLSILPGGMAASQDNGTPQPPPRNPALTSAPLSVNDLIARAQSSGRAVRVIVGLNTAYTPSGSLNTLAAVQQFSRISQTRNLVKQGIARFGASAVANSDNWQIPYMAVEADADTLAYLAASPQVVSIQEDHLSKPTNNQISLEHEGVWDDLNGIWGKGFDGTGNTVAIIDTGVESTHSFLTGKVVAEFCSSSVGTYQGHTMHSLCPGGDSVTTISGAGAANPHTCDALGIPQECEHGTHVAGIAAGNDGDNGTVNDGVARGATIIATQVFTDFVAYCPDPNDITPPITMLDCALSWDSDQIAALNYVYSLTDPFSLNYNPSLQITSVNMSLGGGYYNNQAACDYDNSATKVAVDQLRSVNIATIIASGNDYYDTGIAGPGCISTAVAVGSIDDANPNAFKISWFTNVGPMMDLLASGKSIYSSIPTNTFAYFDGTSMATPQVTGAWAVMREAFPLASVTKILQTLQATGRSVVDNTRSTEDPYGINGRCIGTTTFIPCSGATYKLINVGAAIDSLYPSVPVLTAPADNTLVASNVMLAWSELHAGSYELQIDTVPPTSGSPTVTLTGTSYSPPGLIPGTRYYWRVRALNYGAVTAYSSPVRSFSVTAVPPRNYVTSPVTLTWNRVSGIDHYEIEVSLNTTFTTLVFPVQKIPSTSLSAVLPALTPNVYFWRMRGCTTATTCGMYSIVDTFTVH